MGRQLSLEISAKSEEDPRTGPFFRLDEALQDIVCNCCEKQHDSIGRSGHRSKMIFSHPTRHKCSNKLQEIQSSRHMSGREATARQDPRFPFHEALSLEHHYCDQYGHYAVTERFQPALAHDPGPPPWFPIAASGTWPVLWTLPPAGAVQLFSCLRVPSTL